MSLSRIESKHKPIFKGKSDYSLTVLLLPVVAISLVVQQVLFPNYYWSILWLTFFPGLPIIYWISRNLYYKFYLYEDVLLVSYPLKFQSEKEKIFIDNIKYVEFLNDLRGPNIVIVHLKSGVLKTNRLQFNDWLNKKVFIFLRILKTKGIEIDISNCADKKGVLKKINKELVK